MNSLYRVHILTIALADLFCAGFGVWNLVNEQQGSTAMGVFSLSASVALGFYLVRFIRNKRSDPPA